MFFLIPVSSRKILADFLFVVLDPIAFGNLAVAFTEMRSSDESVVLPVVYSTEIGSVEKFMPDLHATNGIISMETSVASKVKVRIDLTRRS